MFIKSSQVECSKERAELSCLGGDEPAVFLGRLKSHVLAALSLPGPEGKTRARYPEAWYE